MNMKSVSIQFFVFTFNKLMTLCPKLEHSLFVFPWWTSKW